MNARFCALALFTTGCFTWAPVQSLSSVRDDTVRITSSDSAVTMMHANAEGQTIEGTPISDGGRYEQSTTSSPPARYRVDATASKVEGKRVDAGGTAMIVVSLALLTATGLVGGLQFSAVGQMRR